jgi:hypothetical protein
VKVYFVTVGLREELEVIKRVRPPRLLCSYWYFKNKPLAELCAELGYRPEILLDSGAYSAYTKGKNVNLLDYMAYIEANRNHIEKYISLDVIGDERLTLLVYQLMRGDGLNPAPVVHYGRDAAAALRRYTLYGAKQIALGGTVPIRDKNEVAHWCDEMKRSYPRGRFHLLGSTSPTLLQNGALASCDASTWYLAAVKGRPRTIPGKSREAKMARAEANMRRIMEEFNENPVPFTDRGGEPADR